MSKLLLFIFLVMVAAVPAQAQEVCAALGQNSSSAFPVCGTSVFEQASVPICGGKPIPGPCVFDQLTDKNPFWYRFTCFKGGTLGFLIKPKILNEDYDWQLFDITGHDPVDVFIVRSLFVACNWSGEYGYTGASDNGTQLDVCAGFGKPKFSSMPTLIEGHQYLLLISHFSDSQSGYSLSFGGGTASIIDPLDPALVDATAFCGGLTMRVKLNKKMRCSSLAPDGSDFAISTAAGKIVGASGVNCGSGFDMDMVELKLNTPLPPGEYTITTKTGSDNNTLQDNCGREIPPGSGVKVSVFPLAPTPMDSIKPVTCKPGELELVFRSPMLCNTIAQNGSDFVLSGPSPVKIASAIGVCDDQGQATSIKLKLSDSISIGGTYTVTLQKGTDGNTILDVCSKETPAGSTIDIKVADAVVATYTANIRFGCKQDTVYLINNGQNGANQWSWTVDSAITSHQQSPIFYFSDFHTFPVKLVVSNGVCSDSISGMIPLREKLTAAFEGPTDICPKDIVQFKNNSTGEIKSYTWDFGNGLRSSSQDPAQQTFEPPTVGKEKWYTVKLIVESQYNCFDTVSQKIRALASCFVAVPTAFTPNGDGLNDYLYPLNGYKTTDLEFRVYDRLGQLVFTTKDWTKKWDGTFKSNPQPAGTYIWMLRYTDIESKEKYFYKGTSLLIR